MRTPVNFSNATLTIVLSRRNLDIRLLPSLVPEKWKNQTAHFVEPELASKLKKLKNLIDAGVIEHEPTPQGTDDILFLIVCLNCTNRCNIVMPLRSICSDRSSQYLGA